MNLGELNIIEILKLGLPGLVFLLSLLSFHLLTKEQEKKSPNEKMLSSIRQYMFVNIFLALLTVVAPLIDSYFKTPGPTIFSLSARADGDKLGQGNAAVCNTVSYANRNLLIKDVITGKAIQVFSKSVIPCTSDIVISLTPEDAKNLGWTNGITTSKVEVVPAEPGQMFVL